MTETPITQALNKLWEAAPAVIDSLGDEFTYRQFLRALMNASKHAYIELLNANFHREDPFDAAHQQIGKRLKTMVEDMGYDRHVGGVDLSIFDGETVKITYRRATDGHLL